MEYARATLITSLSPEDLQQLIFTAVTEAFLQIKNAEPEDELLSFTEVSRRLGVSKPTLHAWCRLGRITKYKPAGSNLSKLNIREVRDAFRQRHNYQKIKL